MRPIFDPQAIPVIETDHRRAPLSAPRMRRFHPAQIALAPGMGA
jgi:hypothetical protein